MRGHCVIEQERQTQVDSGGSILYSLSAYHLAFILKLHEKLGGLEKGEGFLAMNREVGMHLVAWGVLHIGPAGGLSRPSYSRSRADRLMILTYAMRRNQIVSADDSQSCT
jgi:hypothetical protein